jgi:cell division protein FtsW (lipid II flippase)
MALVTAENVGLALGLVPVVGLGTLLLSVGTYSLSGIAIVRTEAYPVLIGELLLAATVLLLAVFFGSMVLPINWIGVIIEAVLFLLYLGIEYSLRTGDWITVETEPASDTIR